MSYLVPILIVALFVFASFKRVNVYNSFVDGAKQSIPTAVAIFPYLFATFLMVNLLRASGVSALIVDFVSPPFQLVGIPKQVLELLLIRPFSGSGSLAILSDVYNTYGTDSYVGNCASVIMGSSETVFYVSAVYFSQTCVKRLGWAIPIALFCNLAGGILACILCRFL
ncbi:MAG: spore maturation protein [Clostridia bacterium]|nr:spore maturation protein [Clostridia bacterium]